MRTAVADEAPAVEARLAFECAGCSRKLMSSVFHQCFARDVGLLIIFGRTPLSGTNDDGMNHD